MKQSLVYFRKVLKNKHGIIHIVVDTNIWISKLGKVVSLIENPIYYKYYVYLPWIVLQELDHLKDSYRRISARKAETSQYQRNVCLSARKATNILFELFGAKDKRLLGQNAIGE